MGGTRKRARAPSAVVVERVLQDDGPMKGSELNLIRKSMGLSYTHFAPLIYRTRRTLIGYVTGEHEIPLEIAERARRIAREAAVQRLSAGSTAS